MKAYRNFWLLMAVLIAAAVYARHDGLLSWYLEKFSSSGTIAASVIMTVIFLRSCMVAHYAGYRLGCDQKAIIALSRMFPRGIDKRKRQRIVANLLNINLINHADTAVGEVIDDLSEHVLTMRQYDAFVPISIGDLVGELEDRLGEHTGRVEWYRAFLLFLGLLGTIIGIVLALAMQIMPSTPAEVKLFSFNMIKGMGVAYITSMLGMGGAIILYVLNACYECAANGIAREFYRTMYRTVIPTIHGLPIDLHIDDEVTHETSYAVPATA